MKKLMLVLGVVAAIGTAQADTLYWNLMWQIEGAFAPETSIDDMVPVLQDYSIVWSLMSTKLADPIASMEQAAVGPGGTASFGFANFNEYLAAQKTARYTAETSITEAQDLYQRIVASNGTDSFVWESEITEGVSPTSDTSIPPKQILGSDAVIYGSAWNKVASEVPEPATMSLLGLGALAMVIRRKLRK